jgi:hypothetical protein
VRDLVIQDERIDRSQDKSLHLGLGHQDAGYLPAFDSSSAKLSPRADTS